MKSSHVLVALFAALAAALLGGCSNDPEPREKEPSGEHSESRGEHDREGGERGEAGEESGTELALNARYDRIRNGARLVLSYDADANAFVGSVENTTERTLERVRVEVHLSNGKELGPTAPVNLAPGEKQDVKLTTTSTGFDGWTAHPEVGRGEHGGSEGEGEHGSREGRGEHGDREGSGEHD